MSIVKYLILNYAIIQNRMTIVYIVYISTINIWIKLGRMIGITQIVKIRIITIIVVSVGSSKHPWACNDSIPSKMKWHHMLWDNNLKGV